MIAVVPQMRVFVAVEPVDFRNGIDGLVALCRQRLQTDPMSGALFVFGSRRRHSIKILAYDGKDFYSARNGSRAGALAGGPPPGSSRACGWTPLNCSCSCGMETPVDPPRLHCGGRLSHEERGPSCGLAFQNSSFTVGACPALYGAIADGRFGQKTSPSSKASWPRTPVGAGGVCRRGCVGRGTGCNPTARCATWSVGACSCSCIGRD